jgi:hypothetical protein
MRWEWRHHAPPDRAGRPHPESGDAADALGPVRRVGKKALMSRTEPVVPSAADADHRARADYTGGVYGSMLAASVVIGTGTLGSFAHLELAVLLLGTGVAFWIAHVHAQLFGARLARQSLDRRTVVEVCRAEWPIVKAAVPPTVAVAVSPLLGLDLQGTFWLALAVAVAGQVGWSAAAARSAGASWCLTAVTASINLLLGLLIISFKLVLTH